MSCTVCHQRILAATQRYLIDGKKGQLNVRELLSNLPFSVTICSAHVCKTCLQKLKKRQVLKGKENELLEEIKTLTSSCGQHSQGENLASIINSNSDNTDCAQADNNADEPDVWSKRFRADFSSSPIPVSPIRTTTAVNIPSTDPNAPLHSTPRKRPLNPCDLLQTEVPEQPTQQQTSSSTIPVSLKVQWPSETRERVLNKDLESLGKMLVRGTYKQIARASWQNPKIRKELQILALKDIDKECHELCSRKRPSCLRSPSKEQLHSFSFEKLNNELEKRAPFMRAILHIACVNNRNACRQDEWMPTICMAAAVLLRNRSSRLNAVQLLLSIFLYHSSWTASNDKCILLLHLCIACI